MSDIYVHWVKTESKLSPINIKQSLASVGPHVCTIMQLQMKMPLLSKYPIRVWDYQSLAHYKHAFPSTLHYKDKLNIFSFYMTDDRRVFPSSINRQR